MHTARILTLLVLMLAAVASAGGIFIPGLYRFASWLVPATQGQDLVTLLSLPVLFVAMQAARRGSLRGTLTWLGLLGYVGYTYTGAAFAYGMGPFFLLYVALFGLTVFALGSTASTLRMAEVVGRFDEGVPRRSVAGFLLGMAFLLCLLWLAQILPNLKAHPVPERVETFKFVYALDLGLVVPLMVTGAVGLLRRTPLGFVVSGCMLIKAATMGLALLAMNLFNLRAGQPTDASELLATYSLIAFGSLGMATWFYRHCEG